METNLDATKDRSQSSMRKIESENGNYKKVLSGKSNNDVIEERDYKNKEIADEDFFNNVSKEEREFYKEDGVDPDDIEDMSIQCTACWKQVNHHIRNNIVRHPLLGVPICRSCKNFYGEEDGWIKDEEGFDCYCRWCGNGGDLICCDKCTQSFCKRCIQRNKGRAKVAEINKSEKWECFSCCPSQIYDIRSLGYAIFKWSRTSQTNKKIKEQERSVKKRMDKPKRDKEDQPVKLKAELNKVENFIDDNISEAFDTLGIYQKCLGDEKKKWMKARKSMNANNAAVTVRSLRRIYTITKKNMELLDTALVQAYGGLFPEESDKKLTFVKIPGDIKSPNSKSLLNKTPRSNIKRKHSISKLNFSDLEDNEERELINGHASRVGGNLPANLQTDKSVKASSVKCKNSGNASISKPRQGFKVSTNIFKKKAMKRATETNGGLDEVTIGDSDDSGGDECEKSQTASKKSKSCSDFDVSFD